MIKIMQAEKVLMKSPDEALCHLFFYCCSKDGVFGTSEINFISSMFVDLGLNKQLNFKDEMLKYRSYSNDIQDENGYLQDLIQVIRPVNESALFSYCVEVMLSDDLLSESETGVVKQNC